MYWIWSLKIPRFSPFGANENLLNLIWIKIPRFVRFRANLTHFWPKICRPRTSSVGCVVTQGDTAVFTQGWPWPTPRLLADKQSCQICPKIGPDWHQMGQIWDLLLCIMYNTTTRFRSKIKRTLICTSVSFGLNFGQIRHSVVPNPSRVVSDLCARISRSGLIKRPSLCQSGARNSWKIGLTLETTTSEGDELR